jgi:hypothetical protein
MIKSIGECPVQELKESEGKALMSVIIEGPVHLEDEEEKKGT